MKTANPIYQCPKCEGYVYEDSTECHCTIEVWKIISKIDEMIGEYKKDQKELINYGNDGIIIDYQIIALTELKQFIEGIK